jgi:NDP-sugar pyrophosphorylase family protein
MIFAAGLGTRLRPLTDHMPKALVPVAGTPMLGRVLLRLKAAGFTEVVVNVHHFADQIVDYLRANHHFGLTLHVSDEHALLLDTGGGILAARTWLDGSEPFLVHNADIITDLDLTALYRHHTASGATATLLTNHRSTTRYLLVDPASHRLRGWTNLSTGELLPPDLATAATPPTSPATSATPAIPPASLADLNREAFCGIHVLSPSVFRSLTAFVPSAPRGVFPIIPFYLSICREQPVETYVADDIRWFDVGKPATLSAAATYLTTNHCRI